MKEQNPCRKSKEFSGSGEINIDSAYELLSSYRGANLKTAVAAAAPGGQTYSHLQNYINSTKGKQAGSQFTTKKNSINDNI